MVWPSALTTNTDIVTFVFEQGVTRILESGDFDPLHQGVAKEVRLWLESNSIPNADLVSNTSDFQAAAANLFVSKLLASRDEKLSTSYRLEYLRLMRNTRAVLPPPNAASGGTVGKVVVRKQGATYYGERPSRGRFPSSLGG
jgi:hypothetical protein